jgi:hypothetical protein
MVSDPSDGPRDKHGPWVAEDKWDDVADLRERYGVSEDAPPGELWSRMVESLSHDMPSPKEIQNEAVRDYYKRNGYQVLAIIGAMAIVALGALVAKTNNDAIPVLLAIVAAVWVIHWFLGSLVPAGRSLIGARILG